MANKSPYKKNIGYVCTKRVFDFLSSFLLFLLVSWLLLIFTILVKVTSKGPVLFKDIRVGKNHKIIRVFKFRSMYSDAEEHPEKYLSPEQMEEWRVERKVENDPRITKMGRFLRKTSLDELPQLLNIMAGSLSVIGPRPLSEREMNEHFTKEEQDKYVAATPGLIGNWAVHGRSAVTFASGERQRLELEYIDKRSLWFDTKLLFGVIPAVLRREGAQ